MFSFYIDAHPLRCREDKATNSTCKPSPDIARMREALFIVSQRPDGTLIGESAALGLVVCAMERASLQEEARDALIR